MTTAPEHLVTDNSAAISGSTGLKPVPTSRHRGRIVRKFLAMTIRHALSCRRSRRCTVTGTVCPGERLLVGDAAVSLRATGELIVDLPNGDQAQLAIIDDGRIAYTVQSTRPQAVPLVRLGPGGAYTRDANTITEILEG